MRAVVLSMLLVATPAFAGLGSLLAKLGKAGSSGAKVAKIGVKGAKVAKVAKFGAGVAGVSTAMAAERAGFALGGLSDDAARGASFMARGADGEVMMVTRAGGQSVHNPQSAGLAVDAMAAEGQAPTVFLDASAASSSEVVSALPPRARLVLVEEGRTLPLRHKSDGKLGDLVVDTADGALDLGDYLGSIGSDEEDDSWGFGTWVAIAMFLLGALWLIGKLKGPSDASPA